VDVIGGVCEESKKMREKRTSKGTKGKFPVKSKTVHVIILSNASAGDGSVLFSFASRNCNCVRIRAVLASPSNTPLFKLILFSKLKPRSRQLGSEELTFVEERGWRSDAVSLAFEEEGLE
jgi:hypothetical protein